MLHLNLDQIAIGQWARLAVPIWHPVALLALGVAESLQLSNHTHFVSMWTTGPQKATICAFAPLERHHHTGPHCCYDGAHKDAICASFKTNWLLQGVLSQLMCSRFRV